MTHGVGRARNLSGTKNKIKDGRLDSEKDRYLLPVLLKSSYMKKTLNEIPLIPTEHPDAMKRVLLDKGETQTNITQIVVFEMKAGDEIADHKHWRMEEQLFVLEGEVEMIIDNKPTICHPNDFINISYLNRHSIKAITDSRILTVGCKINS